jgi:hypothetical protein
VKQLKRSTVDIDEKGAARLATPTTNRVSRISYLSKHSAIVESPRRFDQRLWDLLF